MKRKNILLIAGIAMLCLVALISLSYHVNVEVNPWQCIIYRYVDGHDICILEGLSSTCGFYAQPQISSGQIICPKNTTPILAYGYVVCDIGYRYCGITRPV